MSAKLTIDTKRFQLGIQKLGEIKRRSTAQIVNQAALDVAGRCWETSQPGAAGEAPAKRSKIKAFMDAQLSQKVRATKSGKFVKAGKKSSQLQRKHLIANYWRGKAGKPGLYGQAMKAYSGKMSGKRQRGVGALMAPFLPIIRALNPRVKFKYPFAKTRGAKVAIWPGSAGSGATPAVKGDNPFALLSVRSGAREGQEGKVGKMLTTVIQAALDWKGDKMLRQAERDLQAEFKKV